MKKLMFILAAIAGLTAGCASGTGGTSDQDEHIVAPMPKQGTGSGNTYFDNTPPKSPTPP